MDKVLFWDFHNTLAARPGMFRSSLRMVLDEREPGHGLTDDHFSPWLQSGFPWDEPWRDYRHLRDPEAWWENLYPLFQQAYERNGFPPETARGYARAARAYMMEPGRYTLYPETLDILQRFRDRGFRHIIVSNHIPELPAIVEGVGLAPLVDGILTSARVGYEKPHPEIFRQALALAGHPTVAFMAGDNLEADVRGAEAVGLPAILVRKPAMEPVRWFARDLSEVLRIVEAETATGGTAG